jgi:acyl-CoA synthetase (NDP forming)
MSDVLEPGGPPGSGSALAPSGEAARRDLTALFDPASIALVGASADESKWGGDLAARLLRAERRRPVYLVNRRGGSMHGRVAYPRLSDLPEAPEMVILAMPATALEATLDEALALGSKAFVAIFAGLGETGGEGAERERAAVARLRAAGALLIGPNCMGLADHSTGLQAVAYLDVPAGHIGLVSQSGAMGEEFVARSLAYGCGFSRYVTLGNQADVGIAEVLWTMVDHRETSVVAVYAEDMREGRELARAAAAVVAAGKPVVLLAPGRSGASARAALSHTGSLAPDAAAVDAVCRATGMVRAATPREFFELTVGFLASYRPRGRRVAIVTDAGGVGGVAADAAHEAGLEVPTLSDELVTRVAETLPGSAGRNPIDFALGTIDPDAYERIVPAIAESDEVDAVLGVGQLGYWGERFPQFGDIVAAEAGSGGGGGRGGGGAGRPRPPPPPTCP